MAPFLIRCKSLNTLAFSPGGVDAAAFKNIVKSVPTITHLVFDHTFFAYPGTSSRSREHMKAVILKAIRPISSFCVDNLLSLLEQGSGDSDSSITQQILPNLNSFTASMKVGDRAENLHSVLEFLKEWIRPPKSSSFLPPSTSLESVTLILDGHPGMGSERHDYPPVDLSAEVVPHAESVGRRVGVDIYLDISYPWQSLYQGEVKKKWKDPDVLLSPKKGLDEATDHTWQFDDAYTVE